MLDVIQCSRAVANSELDTKRVSVSDTKFIQMAAWPSKIVSAATVAFARL
jgi:hypothetical protein